MEINAIGQLISESRMGTRIPEELLGLPSRDERYNRTYSMDPVAGVSGVTRSAAQTQDTAGTSDAASTLSGTGLSVTSAAQAIASLIDNETGTTGVSAFYDVLQSAIAAQQTQTISKEPASDPEYYKNLMTLSRFSTNLISNNLLTFGTSGASIFSLDDEDDSTLLI